MRRRAARPWRPDWYILANALDVAAAALVVGLEELLRRLVAAVLVRLPVP